MARKSPTHPTPTPGPTTPADLDALRLLTEREVSELLRVPVQTLRNHRSRREGLPFVRPNGRSIRYRLADVRRYIEAATVPTEGN
jgi:excisionase family DNA binding protein